MSLSYMRVYISQSGLHKKGGTDIKIQRRHGMIKKMEERTFLSGSSLVLVFISLRVMPWGVFSSLRSFLVFPLSL